MSLEELYNIFIFIMGVLMVFTIIRIYSKRAERTEKIKNIEKFMNEIKKEEKR